MTSLIPLGAAFAFLGLFALQKRAERLAQPLRLEMADIGRGLLAENLSDPARRHVNFLLGSAFSAHAFIAIAYVIVPVAVPYIILAKKSAERRQMAMWAGISAESREAFARLDGLHTRVILANHPLMMSLLWIEITAFSIPALMVAIALPRRGGLPDLVNTDNVLSRIAQRTAGFDLLHA